MILDKFPGGDLFERKSDFETEVHVMVQLAHHKNKLDCCRCRPREFEIGKFDIVIR